ncbi:hypothetical protein BDZ97DRAFT_1659723 [Flammula alnicola]|nr:hypothetical protein BDZ97DRAFT_1659723 [Flammula alnicola]
MDELPIDTSHPAVRNYLALVRLQVLTPLSLLINIASVLTCAFVVSPSISQVSRLYPTAITPNSPAIGAYVAVIYAGQIGYCMLLVMAGKPETKKALIKGVGLFLPGANVLMALWAIAWVMQWFLLSTILQGLLLLLLLFSNIALLIYHPPDSSRPLDTALIHAPLRFFLILPFGILFALSLLCVSITLNLTYEPTPPRGPPQHYSSWHALPAFGVVLGTNLAGLIVVIVRRDIVWCVAATWIAVSLWTAAPKPAPVYITSIVFTAIHPLALLSSLIYARFYSGSRTRRIVLPGDESGHPGLYRSASAMGAGASEEGGRSNNLNQGRGANGPGVNGAASGNSAQGAQPEGEVEGPREVDAETWG